MGNTKSIQSENFTEEGIGEHFDQVTSYVKEFAHEQFGEVTVYRRTDLPPQVEEYIFAKCITI
jgi:hypothetical protein